MKTSGFYYVERTTAEGGIVYVIHRKPAMGSVYVMCETGSSVMRDMLLTALREKFGSEEQ